MALSNIIIDSGSFLKDPALAVDKNSPFLKAAYSVYHAIVANASERKLFKTITVKNYLTVCSYCYNVNENNTRDFVPRKGKNCLNIRIHTRLFLL